MNAFSDNLSSGSLAPSGMIFNIRVTPDLFTGELLNVGVVVVASDGRKLIRVIEEPGRLSCLYGEIAAKNIIFLAQLAGQTAQRAEQCPSPNVSYADPTPFFNLTPEEALAQFFKDQVTVAIPQRIQSERQEPLKTEALRSAVYRIIRSKSELLQQESIIPQSPLAVINTPKGARTVRIPLQPLEGAGALESADYSAQTVRMHLMDALLDIECAGEAKQLKKLGLFVARPSANQPDNILRQIDNAIDYVVWRAPKNCRVEVESNVEKLSDLILDWAEPARKAA